MCRVSLHRGFHHHISSATFIKGFGVSQLSPLQPVLGNGDPLIEILRNALTFERVLQRPAPSHLWTSNRSRMRYPTSQ